MAELKNLIGKRFGRLLVIERSQRKNGTYWKCRCDCGCEKDVISGNLISGKVVSCGCYLNERRIKAKTIHGDSKSRLYNIWILMKARCEKEKNKAYKNYGGRGIQVCDKWKYSYEEFKKWSIENGYSQNLSIDRIDNDGNYEPSNCRWVDRKTQNNNNRMNVKITIDDKTQTLAQWCEELNLPYSAIEARRLRGWNDVDALMTPLQK